MKYEQFVDKALTQTSLRQSQNGSVLGTGGSYEISRY